MAGNGRLDFVGGDGARSYTPLPDRLPPHNLEAEMSVLGCLLHDGCEEETYAGVMEHLKPEHFYRDIHGLIFVAMRAMYEREDPMDFITLSEELKRRGQLDLIGGVTYFGELMETVPYGMNALHYAAIVKEKYHRRRINELATDVLRDGHSDEYTAAELAEKLEDGLSSIAPTESEEEDDRPPILMPDGMADEAFTGLAGEIVSAIEQDVESCREAILGHFLLGVGNIFGLNPRIQTGTDLQRCNLYVCFVGPTGARKGTAWGGAKSTLKSLDEEWLKSRVLPSGGLTSGEGVIDFLDRSPGVFLSVETEFGRMLQNMSRDGNTLSAVLRQAWEGTTLTNPTSKNQRYAEGAHVSLALHITPEELRLKLPSGEITNGSGNRIIWLWCYRARSLPEGGDFDRVAKRLEPFQTELSRATEWARGDDLLLKKHLRDPKIKKFWSATYDHLSRPKPGLHGAATTRAVPNVMRLALIYSVLDRDHLIRLQHLKAALAVWDYCDRTAAMLFGDSPIDSKLGKLLDALANAEDGMSRTEASKRVFKGHVKSREIERLFALATQTGQIVYRELTTGGRKRHVLLNRRFLPGTLPGAEKAE